MKKIIAGLMLVGLLASGSGVARADETAGPMAQGMSLFYKEDYAGAQKCFQQEMKQDPKDSLALNFLLYSSYKTLTMPSVQHDFEEVASEHPNDPVALGNLGQVYAFRAHFDTSVGTDATEQFKQALTIDPNCAPAQTGMGLMYYEKQMMPRARGHFLKAMENNPQDFMAVERLGEILMVDEKKPEEAEDLFRREVQQMPYYPDAHYFLGSAMYDEGKYDDAVKELKVASDLDPKGIGKGFQALVLAGNAMMKKKSYPEAAQWFKLALQVRPDSQYAQVRLTEAQNGGKMPDQGGPGTEKKSFKNS